MEKPVFTVYFQEGVDGYIIAECVDIPGCMSQGRTMEEATNNVKDAIAACLQVMLEDRVQGQRGRRRRLTKTIAKKEFQVGALQMEWV